MGKGLDKYTKKVLLDGIARCKERLDGKYPMGLMTPRRANEALDQYKSEFLRRP